MGAQADEMWMVICRSSLKWARLSLGRELAKFIKTCRVCALKIIGAREGEKNENGRVLTLHLLRRREELSNHEISRWKVSIGVRIAEGPRETSGNLPNQLDTNHYENLIRSTFRSESSSTNNVKLPPYHPRSSLATSTAYTFIQHHTRIGIE